MFAWQQVLFTWQQGLFTWQQGCSKSDVSCLDTDRRGVGVPGEGGVRRKSVNLITRRRGENITFNLINTYTVTVKFNLLKIIFIDFGENV